MLANMRMLGIDYGTKRVGLALSDNEGLMAFPHKVILNDKDFLPALYAIISKESVEMIVIGESLRSDGSHNAIHAAVTELITDLTLETGLPVHLEPEQYTTQEALRFQGRTTETDASAAAIILNSYITRAK